jgi:hypothetical protein
MICTCYIDPDNNKTNLKIADHKYQPYDILLKTIKELSTKKRGSKIEDAVKKACIQNQLVNGYLGYSEQRRQNENADNWNYKQRLWEFVIRYNMKSHRLGRYKKIP